MTALLERPPSSAPPPAVGPLVYRPQPKQEAWHACPAYEAGFGGAKFGGKSLALLAEALRYTHHPRYRGVLFRRTYPRLSELMDRAWQWYPRLGARWRGEEHAWLFPSRAKVLMRHCEHEESKRDYQGHEYQFLGFDQLEEFSESQYLFLLAQNRSGTPDLAPYTRSTFNPGGIGHGWVKTRFIDHGTTACAPWVPQNEVGQAIGTRCFHFAAIDDNPLGQAADPTYRRRLEALPPLERRALLGGDWDVFAGQFFAEWRRSKHIIPYFDVPRHWTTRYAAVDFGFGAPWSCHFYARDEDLWAQERIHRWFAYREFYGRGVRDVQQARLVAEAMAADRAAARPHELRFVVVADPSMWNHKPEQAVSVADVYAREGVHLTPANNERLLGWQRVREYLTDQPDGYPAVVFMDTCPEAIRTVPFVVHDAVRVEDVDTKGEDHAADELRYFVMSVGPIELHRGERPGQVAYGWQGAEKPPAKPALFGRGVDPRTNVIDPRASGIAWRPPPGGPQSFRALVARQRERLAREAEAVERVGHGREAK